MKLCMLGPNGEFYTGFLVNIYMVMGTLKSTCFLRFQYTG